MKVRSQGNDVSKREIEHTCIVVYIRGFVSMGGHLMSLAAAS
jgi:hypothetical protein